MAFSAPGQSLQRDKIVYRIYTDQHGRRFGAQSDKFNNRPVEELRPLDGIIPPWLPNMRFIRWVADQQFEFSWDYRAVADEWSSHTATWYSEAKKFAMKHGLTVPTVGGEVDPDLRAVFGYPGLSPEIPMSAEKGDRWLLYGEPTAKRNEHLFGLLNQGMLMPANEALGLIRQRVEQRYAEHPDLVAPTLPVSSAPIALVTPAGMQTTKAEPPITYNAFFAECRAARMPVSEIAPAWREHKALLNDAIIPLTPAV